MIIGGTNTSNVLSDPTRFNIYQYLIKHHQEVGVAEIAELFDIRPNVARLHLSKLEDINIVESYLKRLAKVAVQADVIGF